MSWLYRFARKLWNSRTCRFVAGSTVAAFVGITVSRTFLGSVAVVDGKSMYPNYPPGMRLYTTAISGPLERGNVVLLDDGHADYAVKRIIGLPGEAVQIWRGAVFINRKLLVEPYLPEHTYTFPYEKDRRGATFILDDDQYFVMGDNRMTSLDSRAYGPVNRNQLKRRAPTPDGFVSAYTLNYTLPRLGTTIMHPMSEPARKISPY
jgi:signal peptidase I